MALFRCGGGQQEPPTKLVNVSCTAKLTLQTGVVAQINNLQANGVPIPYSGSKPAVFGPLTAETYGINITELSVSEYTGGRTNALYFNGILIDAADRSKPILEEDGTETSASVLASERARYRSLSNDPTYG